MAKYSITIPGEPLGKARPRVTNKGFVCTPTPTKNYETLIKELFYHKYGSLMLMDNVRVTITAYFGLNKGDYGKTGLNKKGLDKLSGFTPGPLCQGSQRLPPDKGRRVYTPR